MAEWLEPDLCPLEKDMAQWFERNGLSAELCPLEKDMAQWFERRVLSIREGRGAMVRAPSFVH